MISNFKIDIVNNTSQDIDFALFGNEKIAKPPASSTLPSPSYPLQAVYNPSNGYTYRTRYNDSILVTDQNNNVVATIPGVDISGNGGVYNPFNQTIYFSTFVNKIIAINGLTLVQIPTPAVPNFPVLCPLNNSVYFSNTDFTSTRLYKIAPNNSLSFVPVPGAPIGNLQGSYGAYSPANNTVVFGANSGNLIYIFNCATDTFVTSLATVSRPFEGILNPLNNKIYFSSYDNEIYAVNSNNVLSTLVLPAGQQAAYAAFSPADNLLYFVSHILQEVLYAIDSSDNITAISLEFPTEIIYNPVDQNIYIPTTTDLKIVRNKQIIKTVPNAGFIDYPVLDLFTGTVSFSGQNPYRIYFYGDASLSIASSTTSIDLINNEVNSGAYKVEELKIICTDPGQLSNPVQLINHSLTGRNSMESIFPIDFFGDSFYQNTVSLKAEDLNNFVASANSSIKMAIKPGVTTLFFKGKMTKPGDKLKNRKKMEYYE